MMKEEKIPNLTRCQRTKIYQQLERGFLKKTAECMEMKDYEASADKFCNMGLYEFVCNMFALIDDKEFNKLMKLQKPKK